VVGRRGTAGAAIARLEGRHRVVGGNALRAGVLGSNDGLASNMSLVIGVAGASASGSGVLVAGLAGLVVGGISMTLGEWLSVQSSRELHHFEIDAEAEELAEVPEEEAEELTLICQAEGVPEDGARRMAGEIIANPQAGLDTLAREELGIDPEAPGGSAWEAAIASFLFFVGGGILPMLPFLFARGETEVIAGIAASTAALVLIGAAITVVTGVAFWHSGLRQVVFGLAAAAATYGVGLGLAVAIGG
jgi:VIT1/CCC1 family predicted Fe2+/Mn2+ transporter